MASAVVAVPIPGAGSADSDLQRQSHAASSTTSSVSFHSATSTPFSAMSQNSLPASSGSSTHTLGVPYGNRELENRSHIHSLTKQATNSVHTQEVHIVKVTSETVRMEAGPVTDTFFEKVGRIQRTVVRDDDGCNSDSPVGPPPPSPPASVDGLEIETEHDLPEIPPTPPSKSPIDPRSAPMPIRDITSEPRESYSEFLNGKVTSLPLSTSPEAGPSTQTLNRVVSVDTKSSAATRSSSSTHHFPASSIQTDDSVRLSLETPQTVPSISSHAGKGFKTPHHSMDGFLQPPSLPYRPTRRNTTGSSPRTPKLSLHTMGGNASQPPPHALGPDDPAGDGEVGELASDIQLQAEQIRRERLSKRKAQQQQEAEVAAMARAPSMGRVTQASRDEEKQVLVGNLIGEDHVNYVLMYNMLTGIRIGVSRCQAKVKRPLTDEDFTARHKYSFDVVGNELTPSAKYDFKFKDYAPWVFRELREDYFFLDPADYLLSLTAKYILSELGSPGKSGSFFYFSRDYRFIIKTIHHSEHKFLRSILKEYYAHVKANPHTLLSRFYGLHRVKLPHGRKIHFVIMNNLFPPHRDIHETYDLKGSTVGREYPEERAAQNPRAVLKDLNWIKRGRRLDLGPEKRALLEEQLRRDSELLKRVHVMDYSLLIGIHNMQRGNKDNVRSKTLKVFSPDMPKIRRKPTQSKGGFSPEAIAMKRAMQESDPKRLGADDEFRLPDEDSGERQHFIFYQDEGGLQATDERNEQLDTIYYLGVIDILTPYSWLKKCEHLWKGMRADRHKISPVPPIEYAERFFTFMKSIMSGSSDGGPNQRFKSE